MEVNTNEPPIRRGRSLLLRALHTTQNDRPCVGITGKERIEDWLPPKLLYLVKSCETIGITFPSDTFSLHRTPLEAGVLSSSISSISSVNLLDGRQVAHRQTRVLRGERANMVQYETKLKQRVPIPVGGSDNNVLQLALEWEVGAHNDPIRCAVQKGLMKNVGSTPMQTNYVKVQWRHRCDRVLPFELTFRLGVPLSSESDLQLQSQKLLEAARPKQASDVATWLHAIGCMQEAEWRLELELLQLCDMNAIAETLFFHHILRRLHHGAIGRSALQSLTWLPCVF